MGFVHQLHEITLNYHTKQIWPTYTHLYLTAKWKSHSFVQTRRENNRWTGHRCANYTTLAMSRITLPPAKKTRVHCRWLNHFTDRRVVLALEWDETSDDVRIRRRSSHWCSADVLPAAADTVKQTRGCRRPAQLFLILNRLLLVLTGTSACTRHILDTLRNTAWMFRLQAWIHSKGPSGDAVPALTVLIVVSNSLETPALWPGVCVHYHCGSCWAGRTIWKRGGRDFNLFRFLSHAFILKGNRYMYNSVNILLCVCVFVFL